MSGVRNLLLLGLWVAAGGRPARAQSPPAPPAAAPRDSVLRRPHIVRLEHSRFVAQYDSRYSIINHHFTTINGLKLGIELRNRLRLGGAIYFLSTGVPSRQPAPDNAAVDADAEIRFRYLAGYAGYALLETRRWEISGNLQLGLGSAYVVYENTVGGLDKTPRQFMGVVEPTLAAQLRVFQWAGAGTGLGWRQPVFVPGNIQRELNGPVFYLRANLFLGEFLKVLRKREPLFTQAYFREE